MTADVQRYLVARLRQIANEIAETARGSSRSEIYNLLAKELHEVAGQFHADILPGNAVAGRPVRGEACATVDGPPVAIR